LGRYILTEEVRSELKLPLGMLIKGPVNVVVKSISEIIENNRPSKIISVGDVVSRSMLENGLKVDVFIVDNKSIRKPVEPIAYKAKKTLHLVNPAGTISGEAWRVIDEAINSEGPVKVLVDGEEDLLTIVAVLLAPENSIVVYGQPGEGAVVIDVDEGAKERIYKIISRMIYKPEN